VLADDAIEQTGDVADWHLADVPIRQPDACFQGGAWTSRGSRVDLRSSVQHQLKTPPATRVPEIVGH